jgi:4,5-DOPA dioxygenase extradiol
MKPATMPALFIGHGSPMNAINHNLFTKTLNQWGEKLPVPKVVLCVSAHWMTKGTWVTAMKKPKTIHDFYGFPQELFDVQYPAAGDPLLAQDLIENLSEPKIQADLEQWGLDHGTWSVLIHLFPKANIPVVQLSLDMSKPPEFHFELGQKLARLREHGVLLVGSGNIVHNLRKIQWEENAQPYDWAVQFDEWTKSKISLRDFQPLVDTARLSPEGKLSVPTLDHYLPLLYILGASKAEDKLEFVFEGLQNASISMRSVQFG